MEYSKAIEILRRHNEWRRGAEIPMEEPQVIGDAIDTVVENGCKEQPDVDLEEESYMRGFAQGAKEERESLSPIMLTYAADVFSGKTLLEDISYSYRQELADYFRDLAKTAQEE